MFQAKEDIVKVILAGTALLLFFAVIIVSFVYAYRRKHLKYIAEREKLRASFQQELLQAQLEIQENTLKTISQEIHDNIGQTLSLARLTLNMMDIDKQASFEKIHQSQELVGKAIQELRILSKTLNTETILEAGLINAIEFELGLLERTGGYATELKTTGIPDKLNPQMELILFRIVQESINNIIKHAAANSITITVSFQEQCFCLSIRDNGRGFDISKIPQQMKGGSGLRNIHNRVNLIGGNFSIESNSSSGTCIHIIIPKTKL